MNPLKPLIVTWEYPPRIIGDMAHHLDSLASGLSKEKVSVKVISCHDSKSSIEKHSDNLQVYWACNPVSPQISVITWCLSLNTEVERIISDLFYERRKNIDVVDVHDWHFVSAGVSLRKALGLPFIFTVHSLEDQRSPGSQSPLSSCIRGLEQMGTKESNLVVTKSNSVKEIIVKSHGVAEDKVLVIQPSEPDWIKEIIKAYKMVAS